jgi:hypothetical protein
MGRFTSLCTAVTLGLITGAVTVAVAGGGAAHACSCVAITDQQAFAGADSVFTGKLVGTELVSDGPVYSTGDPERFFFEVDKVFKGKASDRQTVVTARDGASCGLEIGGPGPFIVFAYGRRKGAGGELSSHLCSGTRPLSTGKLPASFGRGHAPTPQPADEDEDVGDVDEDDKIDEVSNPPWFEAAMSVWVTLLFPLGALFLSPAS